MPDAARPDVLVAGYASIDIVLRPSAPPTPGRTVLLSGPTAPPPAFGGCAPTIARALARLGRAAGLVTWLGDDEPGRRYLDLLRGDGVDVGAVHVEPGAGSPRCYLIEDPAGGVACCYHPSGSAALRAGPAARAMLAGVRCLAIAVGPAALTEALLDRRPAAATLAWSVKADADAFPLLLRRRLLTESRIVCLNRHELPFLLEAIEAPSSNADADAALEAIVSTGGGIVVMTAGAAGCRVVWPGGSALVPASPVAATDTTGAGDTFFAAFVDAVLAGRAPVEAAGAATAFAREWLAARVAIGGAG